MLEEPPDFIGNILAKLINSKITNSGLHDKIQDWRMTVVFDTDFYPVSIYFDEAVRIKAGIADEATLIFKLEFGTILELVERKTSMIRAILSRKIKVKGFRHLVSLYRFYGLMNTILK